RDTGAPAIDVQRIARELGGTLISSSPIDGQQGKGVEATIAFSDIKQIQPALLGQLLSSDGSFLWDKERLRFDRTRTGTTVVVTAHVEAWDGSPADQLTVVPRNSNRALEESAMTAMMK